MKTHERLSGVDTAWLRMDEPTNLMTITAVFVLEDSMDVDTLKELLRERLLGFPRFRQRVRDPEGTPHWDIDPDFDLDRHVQRSPLSGETTPDELKARVETLMSTPLDREKPLWDMELIDNYRGGTAVLVRLHHCIGDGIALVQVLLSLTDEYFDPSRFPTLETQETPRTGLVQRVWNGAQKVMNAGRTLSSKTASAFSDPSGISRQLKAAMSVGNAIVKFLSLGPDSDTVLSGELQGRQKVTWSGPVRLKRVKRLAHTLDAKVNDVLLAALAGGLRHYLSERGDSTTDIVLRSLIPVNLRPLEDAFELGNRFGLVYIDLPVDVEDRLERVVAIKAQMDEIKSNAEAITAYGALEVLGYVPLMLEEKVVRFFSRKASAVITNVPGPQELLHMKGSRLKHIMPWVPRAGNIGMGMSIFSYNGEVRIGIACDAGLVPDPHVIVEGFNDEFDNLAAALSRNAED